MKKLFSKNTVLILIFIAGATWLNYAKTHKLNKKLDHLLSIQQGTYVINKAKLDAFALEQQKLAKQLQQAALQGKIPDSLLRVSDRKFFFTQGAIQLIEKIRTNENL